MLISPLSGKHIHENNLNLADYRISSSNTLVLLVSYASAGAEEDPGAMIVDQFSFGPRRVYAILRLVVHGDSWGVDGVTVVPYVAVSVSRVVSFPSRLITFPISECCFSPCTSTIDTPFRRSNHCSGIW